MHIAVAGNIGAGKTTLTQLLSKHYGWLANYETADDNPYLVDFYNDMQRWSFNLQVFFLGERFKQIIELRKNGQTVIQDRTIYEDAEIFAANLHDMNLMSTRDFENYKSMYELMTQVISKPDLLIYLRASVPTLVRQIQKRGRPYEESIRLDYLKMLNEKYEQWIEKYNAAISESCSNEVADQSKIDCAEKKNKLLIINVDEIDFSNDTGNLSKVIDMVDAQIYGLF